MRNSYFYQDEPELRFPEFKEKWNKDNLGNLSQINKGFTPSTSNREYWDDGIYSWLSIADMNEKYLTQTKKKITEKGTKNKPPVPKNKLVMSFKLSIGKLGILKKPMYTNEAIANFDWKNNKLSTEFMFYYLSSINILKYGSQAAKGITLNNETLNSIPIRFPSYEEQQKIANFLKLIDKKIELLEKKLFLYQELDLSFKNQIFNSFKTSSFIKLNDLCQIKKGKQLNKSDMINNGEYYVLNGGKEPSGYTNSWNVEENTITISEGGNSCGFVSYNTEKFFCGGHCYYLILKENNMDLYYLFHYLKYIEPKIMKLRVGSGLPNIQKGDVENINILELEYEKQKEIGNFFEAINTKIVLNLKEKEKLEKYKKSLLQKMFV